MTAAELVSALVAIPSVNPDLVPGGAGEAEVAAYVAGWLATRGLEVEVDEAVPGRAERRRGRSRARRRRSLMLNAHLDTVGVEGMERPFEPEIREGASTVAAATT